MHSYPLEEESPARSAGPGLEVAFHRSIGRFYPKFYAGRNPLADIAIYLAISAKLTISVTRSATAHRSIT